MWYTPLELQRDNRANSEINHEMMKCEVFSFIFPTNQLIVWGMRLMNWSPMGGFFVDFPLGWCAIHWDFSEPRGGEICWNQRDHRVWRLLGASQAMARRAALLASGRHSLRRHGERLRERGAVAACLWAAAGGWGVAWVPVDQKPKNRDWTSGIQEANLLTSWFKGILGLDSWFTGWWFGTFFIFAYIGNNHPNFKFGSMVSTNWDTSWCQCSGWWTTEGPNCYFLGYPGICAW